MEVQAAVGPKPAEGLGPSEGTLSASKLTGASGAQSAQTLSSDGS